MKASHLSIRLILIIYVLGTALNWIFWSPEAGIWFSVGGALALANLILSVFILSKGFESATKKALYMGLIFAKSAVFLFSVAAVLVLLKPLFLPFTMGVLLAIFGIAFWGLMERFQSLHQENVAQAKE